MAHSRKLLVLLIALSMLVVTAACGSSAAETTPGASESVSEPAFALSEQPADVIAAYVFVGTHRHDARQIPCYCGCAGLGHHSLEDCFMKPSGGYEEHASGCEVCRNEANDLKRFIDSGQDARAARTYIDTEYARLGKPTDTPLLP